jgi:2-octaprenylphenol hydroxylase
LGFADAKVLTAELARAYARGLVVTEASILARYQRQRLAHNTAAIKTMAAFKVLFEQQSPYLGLLRNQGMAWVNRMPWLKQQAMRVAQGPL